MGDSTEIPQAKNNRRQRAQLVTIPKVTVEAAPLPAPVNPTAWDVTFSVVINGERVPVDLNSAEFKWSVPDPLGCPPEQLTECLNRLAQEAQSRCFHLILKAVQQAKMPTEAEAMRALAEDVVEPPQRKPDEDLADMSQYGDQQSMTLTELVRKNQPATDGKPNT